MIQVEAVLADGTIVSIRTIVRDGRLGNVTCTSTLHDFAATLEGLPADMEAPALAARIRAAVPFGTPFPDGSANLIANAIRQQLGGTTTARIGSFTAQDVAEYTSRWRTYAWRILPAQPLPAAMNVALDEVFSNRGTPCVRFWNWAESAVIIGRCQSVQNEVDRAAMTDSGVSLVRRLTGGGAMFVQPHGTITYSLILPEEAVAGLTIRQSYEVCDAWVVRGLRELGVDAHHVPVNDIACATGKIGGAAQARRRGGVLHHTTIAYDMNTNDMARVLRIGREKTQANAIASAAKVVSPLRSQVSLPREVIVEQLLHQFQSCYGGTLSAITADAWAEAEELVRTKYGHPDWTNEFA